MDAGLLLFTPDPPGDDLLLADSVVTPGDDRFVTLVIENHGHATVRLGKGVRLGTMTAVELMPAAEGRRAGGQGDDSQEVGMEAVHQIGAGPSNTGARVDELFAQLKLDLSHLAPVEQQPLRALLVSYSDVFALDSSELGSTDLVTHSVDTGDHRPVRARRTPFALRAKIDQLVKEMLDQDVVEPSSSQWAF